MKKVQYQNIFLIGPMGAGKTSVGRLLAKKLNKTFYDSDEEIEKRTGVSLLWLVDLEGMEGYRQRELAVLTELSQNNNVVISTGGECVDTKAVRDILQTRGKVIYMEVALDTQVRRLKRDKKRPILQQQDKEKEQVLTQIWGERIPHYEALADFTILTDMQSVQEVVSAIQKWLKSE